MSEHGWRQLSLLKGRRQKGERAPTASEFQMTCSVAKMLKVGRRPGWFATHIGHGEKRDKVTASRLHAAGLEPGVPDFMIIGPHATCGFHFLELKKRPNRPTPEQNMVADVIRSAQGTYAVAYDLKEAEEYLRAIGALRLSVSA